jgi:hypothetical protein
MNNDHENVIDSKEKEGLPAVEVKSDSKASCNGRRGFQVSDRHFTVHLPTSGTFRSRYFIRSARPGILPRKIM